MKSRALTVSPVGYVRGGEGGFYLEIHRDYRPALKGLEGFSHVNVFWWCHLCDDAKSRNTVECEQPYKHSPATLGIFATRSPLRKPYHPSLDRIRDVSVPEWCSHWPKWYEDSASFDWASEFVNAQ